MTRHEEGSKLAGVVYVHRISDRRFSGIASRNFKILRELCGEMSLKNGIGEAREGGVASTFPKPALDKGARMIRHHNTKQSAHDILRRITNNHPVVLRIQRELMDEHKNVTSTVAEEVVNVELAEEMIRHEADLKVIREEMARALQDKRKRAREVLLEETRRLKEI